MHPESSGTGSLQNLSLRLASSKAYDWRISWNSFFALYCCPWQYNQEQYSSDYDNFISLWFFTDSNRLKNDWTAISYNPKASPQDSATQGEEWTGTVHKWGYNENRNPAMINIVRKILMLARRLRTHIRRLRTDIRKLLTENMKMKNQQRGYKR